MARLAGVDLPREKRLEVALTYIYGVGKTRAKNVLAETGISPDVRVKDLSDAELAFGNAVSWEVHGVALAFVPQTQHVRVPRWAHILGRILLLMTLQILGRNVAEVRVTHDCAALRRAARKGREAAQVAEPR